jgi:hypothetical protein
MDLDAKLPNNLSQINSAVLSNHSNQRGSFEQPDIDKEIKDPATENDKTHNLWQMPSPMNLDSSGLRRSATMTSQNAHLRSASPQRFSSARVLFSTIRSNLSSRLSCWVHSLAVKVQVSSTPTVSRHAFALLTFEPITSTTQISSAKTALKATAKMQASANSNKMPSIFQLIVGSKQMYKRKLQQDLVDFSLPKTISIAKSSAQTNLVNIIFESSNAFSRRLIVTFIKPNLKFPLSKSSSQSAPNSLLQRNDKFICMSILEGAQFASTTFQVFKLIVASTSIANLDSVSDGDQQVSLIQQFVSSTIYSKIFELIDVSVLNKNKLCNALPNWRQMSTNVSTNQIHLSFI